MEIGKEVIDENSKYYRNTCECMNKIVKEIENNSSANVIIKRNLEFINKIKGDTSNERIGNS